MTLLMLWHDSAEHLTWIASDGRLSAETESGGHLRLTDHGAKILEIPVQLRFLTPGSFERPLVASTNLVFAYAGSSLIALQAYAAVQPLWSRLLLLPHDQRRLPSLEQMAAHLGKFLVAYTKEISAPGGRIVLCECILSGYDETIHRVDAWHLRVTLNDNGWALNAVRQDISEDGALFAYGSGAAKALADLHAQHGDKQMSGWAREPLNYLRDSLRGESQGTVGGAVQLGVINQVGFVPMADVQPVELGKSAAEIWHRGFPYSEYGTVGHARVDLIGMA